MRWVVSKGLEREIVKFFLRRNSTIFRYTNDVNRHIEMVSESVTEQLNQIKREWTETTNKTITTYTGGAGMTTKPHSLH